MKLSRIINFILLIPVFCSVFIIYKSALLSNYFPYRLPGHYNKAGYLKLSEVIINTTYSSLTKKNCNYN